VNLSGYAFLAGPTFRLSKPDAPVQPFVRVLVGGVHSYASLNSKGEAAIAGYATTGDSEVGFGAGGGFDWMMTKRWGVRAQVDYIEANFKDPYSDLQHEVRASFGIVMHL
jgi:opacity protein-like surface antigen